MECAMTGLKLNRTNVKMHRGKWMLVDKSVYSEYRTHTEAYAYALQIRSPFLFPFSKILWTIYLHYLMPYLLTLFIFCSEKTPDLLNWTREIINAFMLHKQRIQFSFAHLLLRLFSNCFRAVTQFWANSNDAIRKRRVINYGWYTASDPQ